MTDIGGRGRGGAARGTEGGAMNVEIRGLYFKAVKTVFPGIAAIVGPERGERFENIDQAGWYDGAVYFETVKYLGAHISPQAMALIGNQIVEEFFKLLPEAASYGPKQIMSKVPEVYRELIRGPGTGAWWVESYETGRAVLAENGAAPSRTVSLGILRGVLEARGAYNVRSEVLNERAVGSAVNRYLIEWIHPSGE
jgi:hypothetical protein